MQLANRILKKIKVISLNKFFVVLLATSLTACSSTSHIADVNPQYDIDLPDSEHSNELICDSIIREYDMILRNDVLLNDHFTYKTIWEHAIYEMDFETPKHMPSSKIKKFSKRNIEKQLKNGHLYLYYIINRLKAKKMPLELVVIPIIESNFNPNAVSPRGARGIWQFMKGTSKNFGLLNDQNYSMTTDVITSTDAALRYFDYLYKMFGDWSLAIAAYNVGEGTILKAIKANKSKNLPTDLWHLNIPKSGKDYVESLYSYVDYLRQAQKNDLNIPQMYFSPVFKIIPLKTPQSLEEVSKKTGISIDRLQKLNPGFKNSKVKSKLAQYVLIPLDDRDIYENYITK